MLMACMAARRGPRKRAAGLNALTGTLALLAVMFLLVDSVAATSRALQGLPGMTV